MITVEGLSKNYGQREILHNLSFKVNRGEIVGFLGPNGAGKSTLMKILAGYLPPTSGSVLIHGLDLFKNSLEVRSCLGYLPENVPLYPEMRVGEYLRYRAALKRVRSRRIAEKVIDVLDLCNLRSVEEELIGTLSKGYRQRVGLADALVNEPDLLILDEPTMALDPKQQSEICSLIKTLAKRHTVLLSSHFLNESEAMCHRLIILNRGEIAAQGTPKELRQRFSMPTASLNELFIAITHQEEEQTSS